MIDGGKGDVARLSRYLAFDDKCSDYDLWRALKTLNNELHRIERLALPIPIEMIYARQIMREAKLRRGDLDQSARPDDPSD